MTDLRVVTTKQPHSDLIMAGVEDVLNMRTPVSSTLPQWMKCDRCERRMRRDEVMFRPCSGLHSFHGDNLHDDGPFPFTLGIHAAKTLADSPGKILGSLGWTSDDRLVWAVTVRLGVLLGTVQVTGCHHADDCGGDLVNPVTGAVGRIESGRCSRWAEPDCWHWQLDSPEPLAEPVPMRGRQGLWTLDRAVIERNSE